MNTNTQITKHSFSESPLWQNLIAYPHFEVDHLTNDSLFWQMTTQHPFYTVQKIDKGIAIANFYHEPIILQNNFLGNRLFLKSNHTYSVSLTYQSHIKLILGLYAPNTHQPVLFWVLKPSEKIAVCHEPFEIPVHLADVPLHLKIIIPDTQTKKVFLHEIAVIDHKATDLPEVTIGMVTYNRKDHVSELLEQIQRLVYPAEKIKVVVINNASIDGTETVLAEKFPWATVIHNQENLGGSGGFNTFLKYLLTLDVPTPYAWLIDDDAKINQYTLLQLARVITQDEHTAIAGSVMMDLEKPTVAYEAGGHLFQSSFGWKANLLQAEIQHLTHIQEQTWDVGYVAAYSLLFRTDVLNKAGIWRNYFLHVDDSEWCYRVQRTTGKKAVVVLDSFIWHILQGVRKPFTTLRYYETRNFLNYFAYYGQRKAVAKVLLQCVRFSLRQLVIKRNDLYQFHLTGIADFFEGHYGKKELARSAQRVMDVIAVIDEYERVKKKKPKRIFLVREMNDYVNDGIDYETAIMQAIRKYSPKTKIIETGFHLESYMPSRGDKILLLAHHPRRLVRLFQQTWKIFVHQEGIVILPFWNEGIIANNLATLTAVYENHGFSMYWCERWKLVKSVVNIGLRTISWGAKIFRRKYDPDAAQEKLYTEI